MIGLNFFLSILKIAYRTELKCITLAAGVAFSVISFSNPASAAFSDHRPHLIKPFKARTQNQCGEIDVRDGLSEAMREFFSHPRYEGHYDPDPSKDDAIGDCFAMVAADQLSYLTGQPVSALHLFFNYMREVKLFGRIMREAAAVIRYQGSPILDGGFTGDALQEALDPWKFGMCSEVALPSSHPELDGLDFPIPKRIGLFKTALLEARARKSYDDALNRSGVELFFPGIAKNSSDAKALIRSELTNAASNGETAIELLTRLANRTCLNHMIEPPAIGSMRIRSYGHVRSDILTPIDEQLNAKPHANLVSFLYDTGSTRQKRNFLPFKLRRWIGTHYSSILGRKWNQESSRCEYLVRDSLYQDQCVGYTDHVRCNHNGTFWISDQLLWEITSKVTYIEMER